MLLKNYSSTLNEGYYCCTLGIALHFFTYSTKFGRAAKGARNCAVPTQFEGGLIFFWDWVGMNWNQAGVGVRARTQYEATPDGVCAPQGGSYGGGRCRAQRCPSCVGDGPLA